MPPKGCLLVRIVQGENSSSAFGLLPTEAGENRYGTEYQRRDKLGKPRGESVGWDSMVGLV